MFEENKKHILVADDEQEVVEQIKHTLVANLNCVVDVAYNGKEALDTLRAMEHCDLLILDILLPKLNGIEVCEFMIQDQKMKQIPTLLISILPLNSDDFQKSLIKFKEFAVVKDVLEKPFSDSDLLVKVKGLLQNSEHEVRTNFGQQTFTPHINLWKHQIIKN